MYEVIQLTSTLDLNIKVIHKLFIIHKFIIQAKGFFYEFKREVCYDNPGDIASRIYKVYF